MRLAVVRMSKSSELAILDYGTRIQKQELYPLVRILARDGQVDEAIAEKNMLTDTVKSKETFLISIFFRRQSRLPRTSRQILS